MPTAKPLIFSAAIPNTGTPIGFAGDVGEAGFIKLQRYMTAEQIEQLLNLWGYVLIVTAKRHDRARLGPPMDLPIQI
jgi:hypothetical protein